MGKSMRITSRWLCVAFVAGSLAGCAGVRDTLEDNPRTAIGAGVGTLGGAVIGGTVFDSAGAAVAGGLLGGLAGGAVGRALESEEKDYEATARDYGRPRDGTLVRIEDVSTDVARLSRSDRVHLVAKYALLPENRDRQLRVTERWQITHNGRVVGNPTITTQRSGGTWSSAIPVDLPASAEDGVYRATVTIEAGGSRDRGTTTFDIG